MSNLPWQSDAKALFQLSRYKFYLEIKQLLKKKKAKKKRGHLPKPALLLKAGQDNKTLHVLDKLA